MRDTCTDDIRRHRRESFNSLDCASILVFSLVSRRNWKLVAVFAQQVRQFSVVLSFHIAKAEQRLRTVICKIENYALFNYNFSVIATGQINLIWL